jgi:hypothetical protein
MLRVSDATKNGDDPMRVIIEELGQLMSLTVDALALCPRCAASVRPPRLESGADESGQSIPLPSARVLVQVGENPPMLILRIPGRDAFYMWNADEVEQLASDLVEASDTIKRLRRHAERPAAPAPQRPLEYPPCPRCGAPMRAMAACGPACATCGFVTDCAE